MTDALSLAVAVLALFISGLTAWLTLLRRGAVEMTQPTVIFFGNDSGGFGPPKIYLRALLYPTAKRGRVIQSLHATLARNETRQTFNIWVYGDKNTLLRGSGLYVGETGVVADHHFVLPNDAQFSFVEGVYRLEIIAQIGGDKAPTTLWTQTLELTRDLAKGLEDRHTGVYFDWGPDSRRYIPHLRNAPTAPTPQDLAEAIGIPRSFDDSVT